MFKVGMRVKFRPRRYEGSERIPSGPVMYEGVGVIKGFSGHRDEVYLRMESSTQPCNKQKTPGWEELGFIGEITPLESPYKTLLEKRNED